VFPFINPGQGQATFDKYHAHAFCRDSSDLLSPETCGVHWYAGSPMGYKMNNLITESNVFTHDNTVCNIVKNVLEKDNA